VQLLLLAGRLAAPRVRHHLLGALGAPDDAVLLEPLLELHLELVQIETVNHIHLSSARSELSRTTPRFIPGKKITQAHYLVQEGTVAVVADGATTK
jgi:hypothetical protein